MDEKLEKYKRAVESCAKIHKDNMLHNEGNAHALIIFENLLKYAEKEVRIVAKDMANTEVVNTKEYVDAMKAFLRRENSRLYILLSNFNNDVNEIAENNVFKMIADSRAYQEKRVKIKHMNGRSFKSDEKPVHFCTADSIAYRVERDIERRIAHGNFGDSKTAKKYEQIFDRVFANESLSTDIDLNQCLN